MITMIPADEEARRQLGITDPALRAMVLVNGKAIDGHILFVIRETVTKYQTMRNFVFC